MIGYEKSGSVEVFEAGSEGVKDLHGGSTGVLMSTLWNQSGAADVGNNTTITYNEYCPTAGNTHTLTGCTNTAAGQLIYYFIEKQGLELQLTLTASDAYTSVQDKENLTIQIKADGSTSGTVSFDKINEMLAEFDLSSASDTSALVYACGVIQQAEYGVSATSTAWNEDVFIRAGLESVNIARLYWPNGYYWGSYDGSGNDVTCTITDGAWEVLIENLQAGAPVGTSYPGHALIIDGYNADEDTFHINFGWGSYSKHFDSNENLYQGTGWYSREEMIAQQYYEFIYDLAITADTTFTVNDADLYGTGTMLRAFERANGAVGDNSVVFDDVVAGKSVELRDRVALNENIQINNFNMTVKVTDSLSFNWGYGFYIKNGVKAAFEDFSGALIVNTGGGNAAFWAGDRSQGDFSINTSGALIYGGGYAVDGDYSTGAEAVLNAMSDHMQNGGKLAAFAINASKSAYSFSVGSGNDTIVLDNGTLCLGNMKLHSGTDTLTVTGGSEFYGDVYDCETITIDSTSKITGTIKDAVDLNLLLVEESSGGAMLTITSELSYMASRLANITVNVADAVNTVYTLLDASSLKGVETYLAGLVFSITGSGKGDCDLSINGTSSTEYASLSFADGVYTLSLTLDDIKPPTVPDGLSAEVSNDSAVLDWNDASDNYAVSGYEYRFGSSESLDDEKIIRAAESNAALANLSNGTYYYQVRAYDEAGNYSDWSAVASFVIDYTFYPVTVVSGGFVADKGTVISGRTLTENEVMHVSSGGSAVETVAGAGASVNVSSGGVVSQTAITGGGNMAVLSGGNALETTLNGGIMNVRRGGSASGIELLSGDLTVFGGAVVDKVNVEAGANLILGGNGAVNQVSVAAGGVFNGFTLLDEKTEFDRLDMCFNISNAAVLSSAVVSSGATALKVDVKFGATLYVQNGGSASVVFNPWGGTVSAAFGAEVERLSREADVYYGSWRDGVIQSGAVLSGLTVAPAQDVMVYGGGKLTDTAISGGAAYVHVNASAENISLEAAGKIFVSGGNLSRVNVSGGIVYGLDGAEISGLDLGRGVDEVGIDKATGKVIVRIDPRYFRPAEVDLLLGDATKARTVLKWEPSVTFEKLVELMVAADLRLLTNPDYEKGF